MAENEKNSEDKVIQWVTFKLDDETYGIPVMQVMEVLRVTEVTPVPGAPDYVIGIINLRGNVVTVIDARKRFGLSTGSIEDASRIVIVEAGENIVGMLVDCVTEVVYLKESEIDTAPNVGNEESSRFIQGVHSKKDYLLILVDVNKMLTSEEWDEVTAI